IYLRNIGFQVDIRRIPGICPLNPNYEFSPWIPEILAAYRDVSAVQQRLSPEHEVPVVERCRGTGATAADAGPAIRHRRDRCRSSAYRHLPTLRSPPKCPLCEGNTRRHGPRG